jgi:hypothetical protein
LPDVYVKKIDVPDVVIFGPVKNTSGKMGLVNPEYPLVDLGVCQVW